jgi:hypothetical protein
MSMTNALRANASRMSLTKFLFCFEPISAGVINIAEGIRYNVTFARGIRQRHHFLPTNLTTSAIPMWYFPSLSSTCFSSKISK